jgi:hypothetical protein
LSQRKAQTLQNVKKGEVQAPIIQIAMRRQEVAMQRETSQWCEGIDT